MCKYQYHYYASCAHQQLVCFDFCDQATAITAEPTTQETNSVLDTVWETTPDGRDDSNAASMLNANNSTDPPLQASSSNITSGVSRPSLQESILSEPSLPPHTHPLERSLTQKLITERQARPNLLTNPQLSTDTKVSNALHVEYHRWPRMVNPGSNQAALLRYRLTTTGAHQTNSRVRNIYSDTRIPSHCSLRYGHIIVVYSDSWWLRARAI